jgi:hypothetical protein
MRPMLKLSIILLTPTVGFLPGCSRDNSGSQNSPTGPTVVSGPPSPIPATYRIEDAPCVASATQQVTCAFIASPPGGGDPLFVGGYYYVWRFTNPATGRTAQVSSWYARPILNCEISPGDRSFTVRIELTIGITSGIPPTVITGSAEIARAAGACS